MSIEKICSNCQEKFSIPPSRTETANFCSIECRSKAWNGKGNPNWKGGEHVNADGYIKIFRPDHPSADPAGYVYQHRLVMERYCGGNSLEGKRIHHLNGDKADNRIENLTIETASSHRLMHTAWEKELGRPLRIFGTPWHISHQHSLLRAIPNAKFSFVTNSIRRWGIYRPLPSNVEFVPYYEPGRYDLAILHADQQIVDPSLGKSRLYRELNEAITDIPKIVIQHGTSFWPELFTEDYIRMKMKSLIGDNHMIVNSHRAKDMWAGVGRSITPIIHGMDSEEWFDLPKEPRVVTMLSPAGLDRYYNRRLLSEVKGKLKERGIPHCWITVDWIAKDFDDYRNFLGRSLIYFNPTLESPMPRSRTEAMLSGCCVITLPNHGAETFIQNGINGFTVPNNPMACVELIEGLLKGGLYKQCVEIGQRGKETARQLFSKDRYQQDWINLITKVLKEK